MLHGLRIGTAGWSYDDWKGIVYPSSPTPEFDPLALIAGWFDCVEVNVTFYRPMEASRFDDWNARTGANPRFRFAIKLHREFTHGEGGSRDQAREFRASLEPLVESQRLGAVLIQFPWSFENTARGRRRLDRILDWLEPLPRVVELRHASWDTEPLRRHLHLRSVALCSLDLPATSRSFGTAPHVTAPLAYLRLHGRNRKTWFDPNAGRDRRYDYLYSETELQGLGRRIRTLTEAAEETYVIGNNHFRGQAVATALALKGRLTSTRTPVPPRLLRAFPSLEPWAEPAGEPGGQGNLFR